MDEIWKPIDGYEDCYEISCLGRIKSVERKVYNPAVLGNGCYRTVPERIRKPNVMKGYHCIALRKDNKVKVFRVHRLVMEHFGEKQPSEEYQVNHIDGNKSNNCIDNLEWVTPRENTLHAINMGLRYNPTEETKKKMSEASKRAWQNPEYRENQVRVAKAAWKDTTRHKERSEAIRRGIARAKERSMNDGNE